MGPTGRIEHRRIEYDPLPSQKEFHELDARFKGFSGPIGSGKSQALCHEAIRLSYINQGRMGLLGAPTYPMLRDATMAALLETLEANAIPFEHNKGENILLFKDTGSRVLFRPVDEFERLRGTNLAWFGLDELTYTQEESWLRLEGRLRDPKATQLCGFGVWTPKGFDWVYRKFISNPVTGYGVVQAKAFENRHLLARVSDFYSRLKDSYDEKFYQQEVLGNYVNMQGGRVYSAFDRREHVRELRPEPGLPLQWALDFNVDPMSSVVVQSTRDCVHVLDEIVIRQATTSEACEAFLRKFPRHDAGVEIYGDASGNAMQTTGASDFDMIREHFMVHSTTNVSYKVPKANPSIRDRCNLMNRMLKSAAGKVCLLVDHKCKELILDLEQVSYKVDSAVVDKEKDRLRTHLSDALGYLVWQERSTGKKNGPQPYRLPGG
jgi:Terminase large subunit, T4likevirus-type, N-terminal/Terminase RNaseH-like domain